MKMILSALAVLALLAANVSADSSPPSPDGQFSIQRQSVVEIGKDTELNTNEVADDVVVIGGSAKILGDVNQNVVVIGGDVELDSHVGGDVVVVMGDAHLGPKAEIGHDLVFVGGGTHTETGAIIHGRTQEVGVGLGLSHFLRLQWLRDWLHYCAFELRPLSLHVGWVWWLAGIFFLIYFLISVLFPPPVECCVKQISARPATTFAFGVVAKLA